MKRAMLINDGMFRGEAIQANGDREGLVPASLRWSRMETVSRGSGQPVWMTDGSFGDARMARHVQAMGLKGIALLLEPPQLHPENYATVRALNQERVLSHVFTHHPLEVAVAASDHNLIVHAYPFGGTRIHPSDWRLHPKDETLSPSIVASPKRTLPGHALRHDVIEAVKDHPVLTLDTYGPTYTPIERKLDALRRYQFSIAIENVDTGLWFTEALLDCFLTGTVPIYWGSGEAIEFWGFESDGVLAVNDAQECIEVLDMLRRETHYYRYHHVQEAIRYNFIMAHEYTCVEDWLVRNHPELGWLSD